MKCIVKTPFGQIAGKYCTSNGFFCLSFGFFNLIVLLFCFSIFRKDCFENDYFNKCIDALMRQKERQKLLDMVETLNSVEK